MINIEVCNKSINETKSEKLLGIVINNTLNWKNHLFGNDEELGLFKDLSKRIGMLKKVRNLMPTKKFQVMTDAIFTSKLIYGMTLWGGIWGLKTQQNHQRRSMAISKNEMNKLQVLQNKTLRLISGLDYYTPTSVLLETTKMLSVHQMVAYHIACLVFKINHTKLPSYHYNRLFPKITQFQQIERRCQDKEIARIEFDLSLARSSFFYQGSQLWKTLPPEITNAKTVENFKSLCKPWILNNISIIP